MATIQGPDGLILEAAPVEGRVRRLAELLAVLGAPLPGIQSGPPGAALGALGIDRLLDHLGLDRLGEALLRQEKVRQRLQGTEHRLLWVEPLEGPDTKDGPADDAPLGVAAAIYDYTNGRALLVRGQPGAAATLELEERDEQPLPSDEEFAAAIAVVAPRLAPGERPYRVLPPVLGVKHGGRIERVIPVGVFRNGPDGPTHRKVGVNMNRLATEDVPNGGTTKGSCGAPIGTDPELGKTPPMKEGGQLAISVKQFDQELWSLVVVRPLASSPTIAVNRGGSGIELRNVRFKGHKVLHRAHVPIVNVRYPHFNELPYPQGGCAPAYRDWQFVETPFQAKGTDVPGPGSGFRLCDERPQTIFETGQDAGSFSGVAMHVEGTEAVLTSELQTGWYRYLSQWRLGTDGTIRARWGFAAVEDNCTCADHEHHAYFRFDFDIQTASNNFVEEGDPGERPFIIGREERRDRARGRFWRVRNEASGAGYSLHQGNDGRADDFGVGDVWVLRYHPDELTDGRFYHEPSTTQGSRANIDMFVNGERPSEDAVIWYAAHFNHDVGHHMGGGIVGPELRPFNWPS